MIIPENDPKLRSWVEVASDSDFPIQNLPFGVFETRHLRPRVGVAIGEYILDLAACKVTGLLDGLNISLDSLEEPNLNKLIAHGKEDLRALRKRISSLLHEDNESINDNATLKGKVLYEASKVKMLMPVQCGDYTDFYSSIEHASNVGIMFRGKDNALLPNWKHIPVGYHGRASSIVVSGKPIRRPWGQINPNDGPFPEFSASKLLDFELEMAFIVGKENEMGNPVSIHEAENHIFGLSLFNDWSARDIQKWEYVPLGPFLGKNFGSSISPWVVTLDALEPFRVQGPEQEPQVLPYLMTGGLKNYDIKLEVWITAANGSSTRVSQSNTKYLYWNMCQQLAHHTVNGCNLRIGDICASGTISGPSEDSYGSMLELSWRGTKPIQMVDGSERKFLLDGDTVTLKGYCENKDLRIGFGEVSGTILPAHPTDGK